MTLTSLSFVLFFALVLGVYWSIRTPKWQNAFLLFASYVFYAWWDWRFCALLAASTLLDFLVALMLGRTQRRRARKALLSISLVGQLSVLCIFKYYRFLAPEFARLLQALGWSVSVEVLDVALPLGISYYTFKTLSYTIDVYRGQIEPVRSLVDYGAYVAFFPQLGAGPIQRAVSFLPQLQQRRVFSWDLASDAWRQILWGFVKKLVIADRLAALVDPVFAAGPSSTGPQLTVAVILFAFQLYCDFSAYSDIAIGAARLLGFDTPRNFAYPYFSQNIVEFWRRWHITLMTWLREYVYVSLDGVRLLRKLPLRWRLATNTFITFLLSGLWHGATWNFVVWGAIHGLGTLPTLLRSRPRVLRTNDTPGGNASIPSPALLGRIVGTFSVVLLSWVFFRASSVTDAVRILGRIAGDLIVPHTYASVGPAQLAALAMVGIYVLIEWGLRRQLHVLGFLERYPRPVRWAVYMALIWGTVLFKRHQAGPFVYFEF